MWGRGFEMIILLMIDENPALFKAEVLPWKTSVFRNALFLTKHTVPKSIIRLNA